MTKTNVIELPATKTPMERTIEAHNKAWHQNANVETPPSVRTMARQQGIDLRTLIGILELQRPAGSVIEDMFVEEVIGKIEGIQFDEYENAYLTIGENPTIMWSCHTDTVAKDDGRQNVKWDGDFLVINEPKVGQCLGADDGAGLWLLMEMIKAKVPGLYIFHREEEIGGRGSGYIAEKTPDLVKGIKIAIAFDRRDVDSVITHQGGERTCSAKFAEAMCDKLNQVEGLKYSLDSGGSFTDTKSYSALIPECTNISVGYYSEHSTREKLDVRHLLRLREALLTFDFSDLPAERDPNIVEYDDYGYSYHGGSSSLGRRYAASMEAAKAKTPLDKIEQIVRDRPTTIAKMLYGMGMDEDTLMTSLYNLWAREFQTKKAEHDRETAEWLKRNDPNLTEEERLWCNDCGMWSDLDYALADECQNCGGHDVELVECEVDTVTGEVLQ